MPSNSSTRFGLGIAVSLLLSAAGCSSGGDNSGNGDEVPSVVVTTSILGDVVEHLVGDAVSVSVLMPRGASPHEFQPSAQQIASLRDAALVVANGADFEAGLTDVLESAADDGVNVFDAIAAVGTLSPTDDPTAVDPHFFTDPDRMATAAEAITKKLLAISGIDATAVQQSADRYVAELRALDTEITAKVAMLPTARRILVTNHEVFSYFADRYGFRVAGVVIPGGTTSAEPSAADLADLADVIRTEQVPAIFADSSSPTKLAEALADEVGAVKVVELYSESLGEIGSDGGTYLDLLRTDATRIVDALGAS